MNEKCHICKKNLDNVKEDIWACLVHYNYFCIECGASKHCKKKKSCHLHIIQNDEKFVKFSEKFSGAFGIPILHKINLYAYANKYERRY